MEESKIPDTSTWIPREVASETISSAFRNRCRSIESDILRRAEDERRATLHNYDSGLDVEDILRTELQKLLPKRYSVTNGTVVDRLGKTCGDCDCVVFNDVWFPIVKGPAASGSRRVFLPIEGAYAIGEIKQTLSESTLDDAMRKLVIAHRLERSRTFSKRLVENRESGVCSHGLSNPLYSFIVATRLSDGVTFESLINRFYDICKSLKRLEVVRGLCVLGHGTVTWGVKDQTTREARSALFMLEDLYDTIVPVYAPASSELPALYTMLSDVMMHLFHSVLAPEDVQVAYGPERKVIRMPNSPEIALLPDREWIDRLLDICEHDHDTR